MVFNAIKTVKESETFKSWLLEHPNSSLAHVFVLFNDKPEDWQVGFLDGEMITTFRITETEVIANPPAEIFKKPGAEVLLLDESKIKLNVNEAVEKAKEHQKEKFPAEAPQKIICIAQSLPEGQVWNITFLTVSFKTLNIKVDTETGEVLKADVVSLFDFDAGK